MVSLLLAEKILTLLIALGMGIALVRTKVMRAQDSMVISKITLYLVMPCVNLTAFQVDMAGGVGGAFLLALASAALLHLIFIVLAELLQRPLKLDPVEKTSGIYANAGNLIIPIVTSMLGPEYLIYTCAYTTVEQVLFWSHCKMCLCGEKTIDFKKLLMNINMITVFIGAAFFATGLRLPALVNESLTMVGNTIGPLSMIVTGMLIGGMDLRRVFTYRRVWMVAFLRLIAFPLVALAVLRFSGLANLVPAGRTILMITMLAASAPSASTVTQLAQVYGLDAEYASANNVVTTLLCILTMPFILFLYQL